MLFLLGDFGTLDKSQYPSSKGIRSLRHAQHTQPIGGSRLRAFKNACKTVADHLEEDAARRHEQSGEQESEESQRIRELLTGEGGYVFHGTRVTGLTWAYRLSGGNLRAVQAIAGHTSPKMALRYQRAEMDYLAAVAGNVSSMIEANARK